MTPELEQPDDPDAEPTDSDGPGVRNTARGVVGAALQAGVVHGDVHLHSAPPPPAPVVPRQLPAAPGLFTGRIAELSGLDRTLPPTTPDGSDTAMRGAASTDLLDDLPADASVRSVAVMVSAIVGAGGIGKTWLALTWAHCNLDRFPDGQLFVDLHGYSPTQQPMAPEVAVRGFLDALGIDPNRIPIDLDARAALYRSLVAGKRMLIVLDNAATAEQVIPLLPGSSTCIVLVTGRTRLASLIDRHGAGHLPLGVLTRAEARALLTARLGTDGIVPKPDAVDELVELCSGYPLALSITARNAAARPGLSLAEIAAELRELGLEMLDHDTDPAASLPTVLSWSLRRLTDEQRTVFALLGIAPGPDATLPAVVALTGLPPARARKVLVALEEASLLERRSVGRYAMHDLIRNYATITAHDLTDDVREAALVRVMDFHLQTAFVADRLLDPHSPLLQPNPPVPGVHPHPLLDADVALAWLQAEHATLLATQRAAIVLGRHHVVWHLAWTLDTFHLRRGHLHDSLAAWQAALNAATHLPDIAMRIRAHRLLGNACSRLGLHEEAIEHLDLAHAVALRQQDRLHQAHTHRSLAFAWAQREDDRSALNHARCALDLYKMLHEPVWEAEALNLVGWLSARLGDYDTARDHCHAAHTLHRHHHNPAGQADTQASLGFIACRTGDHQQALDHYRQALALSRRLGNAYQVADTLDNVGHPHDALGQFEQAHAVWREALRLYQEQGRDSDAERIQQQLDDLGTQHDTDQPPRDAGPTN